MPSVQDYSEIITTTKTKNLNSIKSNPAFIAQTFICIAVLISCLIMLNKSSYKDQSTILWSVISSIIGAYTPTASFKNSTPTQPALTLTREIPCQRKSFDSYTDSSVNANSSYD